MREIKFRVWSRSQGYMDLPTSISIDDSGHVDHVYCYGDDYADGDFVLMQFTGLKDKNGREIYEDDVVDIGIEDQDGHPVLAPVSYGEYTAGYVLDNGGNGIWQRLSENCTVIGNINESPELLEASK